MGDKEAIILEQEMPIYVNQGRLHEAGNPTDSAEILLQAHVFQH
jgi:hypothetical protein